MDTIKTHHTVKIGKNDYKIIKLNDKRITVKNIETGQNHVLKIMEDRTVKLLTINEFLELSDYMQARYINRVTSDKFDEILKITDDGIFDMEGLEPEEITDLRDYLLEFINMNLYKREELLAD